MYCNNVTETVTWPKYLRAISDGDTGTQIAKRSGVPNSTVSRWLDGSAHPRPRQVVRVARAYGIPTIAALIAADYLDAGDVDLPPAPRTLQLRDFTTVEIMKEIVRRAEEGDEDMTKPLDGNHPAMQ